jgi:alkylation response protein AidB-like acyl-CoA dehydrogenase
VNGSAQRAALLQTVAEIGPILAASADESERLATLAPAAVEALKASGLMPLKLPAVLGGLEADPVTQIEVIEAMALIDTASAWCATIGYTSMAWIGAFLPDAGAHQVFSNGDAPLAASSVMPAGAAMPVEGGYRVTGRWRFCSGVRHSAWITLGAVVQKPDQAAAEPPGPPELIFVVLPASALTIYDNWQAMGLKGTGSCDVSVTDAFVASDFTYPFEMNNPIPQRGGALYRLPLIAFVANEHAGFALGVARRALNELIQLTTRTRGAFRSSPLQDRHVVHRLVGKFDLELAAARALLLERYGAAWVRVEAGQAIDAACVAELQAIAAYITDLAVSIATAAFRYGGGALYQPNILERLLRDILAAGQHIAVGDQSYEVHGRHLLGLDGA